MRNIAALRYSPTGSCPACIELPTQVNEGAVADSEASEATCTCIIILCATNQTHNAMTILAL